MHLVDTKMVDAIGKHEVDPGMASENDDQNQRQPRGLPRESRHTENPPVGPDQGQSRDPSVVDDRTDFSRDRLPFGNDKL